MYQRRKMLQKRRPGALHRGSFQIPECLYHRPSLVGPLDARQTFVTHPLDSKLLLPASKQKEHYAAFLSPFNISGHTGYPFIYPVVTGYTLADGEPCSALNTDGTCSIHADKPDMCRAVPFDPVLPENLQGPVLAQFKRHGCMAETREASSVDVIFECQRITNPDYQASFAARFQAIRTDCLQHLNSLVGLLGPGDAPGKLGLPSLNAFREIAGRGSWFETSMVPLLLRLGLLPAFAHRVREFIEAQQKLIEQAIDHSIQVGIKAHRKRTEMMRNYLAQYDASRKALSELTPETSKV
jgi:Fe-S-cluster containining protein